MAKKTCETCVKGQLACMYVTVAQSSRTTVTQQKAHDILCGKCPCRTPHGQCMRVLRAGCTRHIPIDNNESEK